MRVRDIDSSLIRAFTLVKACGRAGFCRIGLHGGDGDDWLSREGQTLAVFDDGDEPIFFGRIMRASVERTTGLLAATLEAQSLAAAEDIEPYRRFFQKPGKTFGDILDASRLGMQKCALTLDNALKNKAYEPLLLQNESNFAFVKRLASEAGRKLWVVDNNEGQPGLAAAFCLDRAALAFTAEKIISLRVSRVAQAQAARVVSREYCALGRRATLPGIDGTFLVTRLRLALDNGRDIFVHDMLEYEEKDQDPTGLGPTIVLTGTIADAADPDNLGRIKFSVDSAVAEDADSEKSWLPWVTPYAGTVAGMTFIPEKDDPAQLVLCGGKAFVQAALRSKALPDEAQNPADKYLGNNFGQRILWKDGALELRSGDSFITMKTDEIVIDCAGNSLKVDKSGIHVVSQKTVAIQAEENFEAKSGRDVSIKAGASLGLDSSSGMKLHSGSGLDVKSSASASLSASGSMSIKGSKVQLG